jgi:polyisoprenoid-binding protein YceI
MLGGMRSRLLVVAGMVAVSALAADTGIDVAKSNIIATFKQEGVSVDAPFKKFSGRIVYDQANLAATSASLDVDTASLDIGDESYNAEVRKKEWFDSATYPRASFRSTAIKAVSEGRFDATGNLTIKGRVLVVTVPITVKKSGVATTFDGSLSISRNSFGIGGPSWNELLDDKVTVRFHLVN